MSRTEIPASWLWMLSTVAVTAVAFSPAVTLFFLSDDYSLIETARNTPIGSVFGTENVYYRPILILSYVLEHALWQAWAPGYHATNVALHLANTVLVCLLAQRVLTGDRAWILAGMCFGLTATHASSVLWICGRTDLLCATFYLLFGHLPASSIHIDWSLRPVLANLARYIVHLVSPLDLENVKPFFRAHPTLLLLCAAFILGVSLLALRWIVRSRVLLLSALWTGIALLPVLRVFGPWYLYIPSTGVALACGYALNAVIRGTRAPWLKKAAIAAVAILLLFGLAQTQRDTKVASDLSYAVVSDLMRLLPVNGRAIVLNLPPEYRSVPVFGWPGNLSHALRLLEHPLSIDVISSVRYTTQDDSVDVELDRRRKRIDIRLLGDQNFFRVYDDVQALTGRAHPQVGHTYETPNATTQITGLNVQGHPSSLAVHMKSSVLTEKHAALLLYSRGCVTAIE